MSRKLFGGLFVLLATAFTLSAAGRTVLISSTSLASILTISATTVFLGGFLAFLSPCAGFIIPVFSYFHLSEHKLRDLLLFLGGFNALFVPLTLAGTLVAKTLIPYTQYFYAFAAVMLLILAVQQFFSSSCSTRNFLKPSKKYAGLTPVFLGTAYAFTSIGCTGPILGTIITLSYTTGTAFLYPFALALIFGFGMVLPVAILSFLPGGRRIIVRLQSKTLIIPGLKRMITAPQLLRSLTLLFAACILYFMRSFTPDTYEEVTKIIYAWKLPGWIFWTGVGAICFLMLLRQIIGFINRQQT